MESAIRLRAPVLPGKRIEFTAPELPDTGTVELIVMLPGQNGQVRGESAQGVWDYVQSLQPVARTAEEWEAIEREFREEREAWDR